MAGPWTAREVPDQRGRTAVITGASGGLGYETALVLAEKGAEVIFAVRSEAKGKDAIHRLKEQVPGARVRLIRLDLSDLSSVRSFAEAYRRDYGTLDLLINNAGVMVPPYRKTTDGFELQFGSNHLGHFALTGLLLPQLLNTPKSRVVTLSSIAHLGASIDFDNLDGSKGYNRIKFYGQSKLANLLFAKELQRRLAASGAETISIGCHPGVANTNLFSRGSGKQAGVLSRLLWTLFSSQSAAMGALPTLYAATAPGLKGGEYIGPDGRGGRKGYPQLARTDSRAEDEQTAKRLWDVSESLTGVTYPLPDTLERR